MRKSFLANLANERVRYFMDWHVFFEVDCGCEGALAKVALKTFIAMESFHVFNKIVSERKGFVAVVTLPLVLQV